MSDITKRKITPGTLKLCLDEYLGPDRRMTQFSYEYETKILLEMGFSTIDQIEDCISDYDDDQISSTLWGHRQGQIKRFIVTLVAAMGDNFVRLHPWARHDWFPPLVEKIIYDLRTNGIHVGEYVPEKATDSR